MARAPPQNLAGAILLSRDPACGAHAKEVGGSDWRHMRSTWHRGPEDAEEDILQPECTEAAADRETLQGGEASFARDTTARWGPKRPCRSVHRRTGSIFCTALTFPRLSACSLATLCPGSGVQCWQAACRPRPSAVECRRNNKCVSNLSMHCRGAIPRSAKVGVSAERYWLAACMRLCTRRFGPQPCI